MWLSINLGHEYTITRQIPVVLENMKDGTALRYPVPKSVSVRFKGLGWQLAVLSISPDVKYYIDVSTLTKEGFSITQENLPEHVKLPIAALAVDVKPETLQLGLDIYKEKRVPLLPQIALLYHEGFGQVGPLSLRPESVVVAGAKTIVDTISEWHTSYKRYDDRRAAIEEDISVEESNSYDIEVYPSSTRLHVDIQPFAEKTIAGIPVVALSAPLNREVIFIPPKMDVTVRGGIDQLAALTLSDFRVAIDFSFLLEDSIGIIQPQLHSPEGIRVLKKSPERFQFLIRKRL